ncbi:type II secretion system F family protein [Salinibacterium soli]|uniref:Type II secretion system F family protein n=1 Tax=Antiquaquibacter soli TaxID=3064523 RepID=A0ABT9BQ42_9MICO|nr:type II secretion system F family protein [Protaetiibacter sp. WY-16]MDO7881412.1 type II secretion system F family protein [Protaetiibacter sp. WY-16]
MSLALGLALGAGTLLVVAPFFWPRVPGSTPRRSGRMHDRLVQAGLPAVSPAVVLAVSAALAVVAGGLGQALLGVLPLSLGLAGVAGSLPAVLIGARARSRRRSTRVIWPDVVDQLVSAVRSGLALPDSLVTLATVGPEQTRAAFAAFEQQYRATGSFGLCIDSLKDRLADPVADRILETLRMAREVGGSELTTVLRALGAHLRQEAAIRSEVEARQSWVVNAARLGVAAPWIVLVLLATRPEAAVAYNSPAGAVLVAGGLVVSLVAYRLMIGLGRLPEERRWFA